MYSNLTSVFFQKTNFSIFYWAMTESYVAKIESEPPVNEHQMEFLESWLTLAEKFSNPKTILDSQHQMVSKSLALNKSANFEPNAFLGHLHKVRTTTILLKPVKLLFVFHSIFVCYREPLKQFYFYGGDMI